ncbi:MAG: ATP-dependent metallopeptidase FtsH/Yme1/Tma family protein, partial [Coriobacteriales bacterium]|nr:ATP-dependent metallopeptidase FtsH/Yme1/Tma family protein [Coriobacteriales bacterium]
MAAPTATARTIQPTKKLKDSWDALPRSTRLVIIAIFGALVLGLIIWWLFGGEEGAYMEYRSFKNLAESGQVTEVVINNDRVDFSAYSEAALDGSSAQDTQLISYWTDNPRTDTFKEELLLRGIKVTEAASGDEIFGIILDIFFFVIIVGSIVALAGRLVSFDRTTFKLVHKTGVTFDDIAGMDSLKRELSHVVDVLKNPQKY